MEDIGKEILDGQRRGKLINQERMTQILALMGTKSRFKPYCDDGFIMLRTKRPVEIKDGVMSGSEIFTYDSKSFKVWTSQKKKANRIAVGHGLEIKLLDGEAEVMVPVDKADELLPMLGAKVKRVASPAQEAVLARARAIRDANT